MMQSFRYPVTKAYWNCTKSEFSGEFPDRTETCIQYTNGKINKDMKR